MPKLDYSGDLVISLPSADLKTTQSWYLGHLGFTHLFSAEQIGWMELETHIKGVTLGFGQNIKPAPGNAVPVFGVRDLDAARDQLESKGVAFDGDTIVIPGMVKLATFYDPDKNALMLSQNLSTE